MTNKSNIKEIKELRRIIREAKAEGFDNIAQRFEDELDSLLANDKLVGNNPHMYKVRDLPPF